MAFKVILTEKSLNDLEDILDYISADNPEAAARFGEALLRHTEMLAIFPRMGALVNQRARVRKILHTPIRIYYRVDEKRESVEILHFWHTARQEPKF